MNLIKGRIFALLKTNLSLSKRLARKSIFSFLFYFFLAVMSIIIGFLTGSDRPPILYITFMALFFLYLANIIQLQRKLFVNPYQLKIFPLSNHLILCFLWLSGLVNLKALVFVIPVMVCIGAIISFSQFELMIIYAIYAFLLFVTFGLLLLIINLLLNDFRWLLQPLLFFNLAVIITSLSQGRIISNFINTDTELGFDSLSSFFPVTLLALIVLYVWAYYLIFFSPAKSFYSTENEPI